MSTGALYGDLADRIEQLINLNEALVELLEAARADAKEAEAYAEELEKENTRLSGLMSERGQMLRRYDQMVVDGAKREEAWKAKLAKAVEALQAFKAFDDMPARDKRPDVFEVSVRRKLLSTLAEIEGEKG
jgi:chromosome segregation ATPase